MLSLRNVVPQKLFTPFSRRYAGAEEGKKRVRWHKRQLETSLYLIITFLLGFMDFAHHVPMWVPS